MTVLVEWFLVDADYLPEPYRVFFNARTGESVLVYDTDEGAWSEGIPVECNAADRARVQTPHFVELPLPTHEHWHTWFQEWLEARGDGGTYFGSIGGWFKNVGCREDRQDWDDFRYARVGEYVAAAVAHARGMAGIEP